MSSDLKISVIVPIYNVEAYLEQCIESLKKQTLAEIEFILIDDGSTDNSGRIAETLIAGDPRFRFFRQENRGYAGARNAALPLARGKYLGFVDSDDWVTPQTFQRLYELAEREGADISGGSFCYFFQQAELTVPENNRPFAELLHRNGGRLRGGAEAALFDNAVTWNRIYLREMIEKYRIRFAENMRMAEDVPFFWCSFAVAEKIALTTDCLYFYRNQREGQQTSFADERLFSFFTLFENFEQFLKANRITGLEPYLLHLKLSRYCYGYEHLQDELKPEFFRRIAADFAAHGITADASVASGPGWGKYGLLRILHPLTLRAVLKRDERTFSRIVEFRHFLGEMPRLLRSWLHF